MAPKKRMDILEQYDENHSPECGSIKVVKVNDPFTYLIRCKSCLDVVSIGQVLKNIVKSAMKIEESKRKRARLQDGGLAIIKDSGGFYYRGCILSCLKDEYYSVLLIDKGETRIVTDEDIFYMPRFWKTLKQQCHLIQVYGVLPSPKMKLNKLKKEEWEQNFLHLVKDADKIFLEDYCEIGQSGFGNIVLQKDSRILGLDKILLQTPFAISSVDFEKEILSSCNDQSQSNEERKHFHSAQNSSSESLSFHQNDIESYNFSSTEHGKKVPISPQHAFFIKAISKGYVYHPDPVLRSECPDSSQSISVESLESSVSKPSAKAPELTRKNSIHNMNASRESNSNSLTSPISSPEDNLDRKTKPDSSSCAYNAKTPQSSLHHDSYKMEMLGKRDSTNLSDSSTPPEPSHCSEKEHKKYRSFDTDKNNFSYSGDLTAKMDQTQKHQIDKNHDSSIDGPSFKGQQKQEAKLLLSPDMFLSDEAIHSSNSHMYRSHHKGHYLGSSDKRPHTNFKSSPVPTERNQREKKSDEVYISFSSGKPKPEKIHENPNVSLSEPPNPQKGYFKSTCTPMNPVRQFQKRENCQNDKSLFNEYYTKGQRNEVSPYQRETRSNIDSHHFHKLNSSEKGYPDDYLIRSNKTTSQRSMAKSSNCGYDLKIAGKSPDENNELKNHDPYQRASGNRSPHFHNINSLESPFTVNKTDKVPRQRNRSRSRKRGSDLRDCDQSETKYSNRSNEINELGNHESYQWVSRTAKSHTHKINSPENLYFDNKPDRSNVTTGHRSRSKSRNRGSDFKVRGYDHFENSHANLSSAANYEGGFQGPYERVSRRESNSDKTNTRETLYHNPNRNNILPKYRSRSKSRNHDNDFEITGYNQVKKSDSNCSSEEINAIGIQGLYEAASRKESNNNNTPSRSIETPSHRSRSKSRNRESGFQLRDCNEMNKLAEKTRDHFSSLTSPDEMSNEKQTKHRYCYGPMHNKPTVDIESEINQNFISPPGKLISSKDNEELKSNLKDIKQKSFDFFLQESKSKSTSTPKENSDSLNYNTFELVSPIDDRRSEISVEENHGTRKHRYSEFNDDRSSTCSKEWDMASSTNVSIEKLEDSLSHSGDTSSSKEDCNKQNIDKREEIATADYLKPSLLIKGAGRGKLKALVESSFSSTAKIAEGLRVNSIQTINAEQFFDYEKSHDPMESVDCNKTATNIVSPINSYPPSELPSNPESISLLSADDIKINLEDKKLSSEDSNNLTSNNISISKINYNKEECGLKSKDTIKSSEDICNLSSEDLSSSKISYNIEHVELKSEDTNKSSEYTSNSASDSISKRDYDMDHNETFSKTQSKPNFIDSSLKDELDEKSQNVKGSCGFISNDHEDRYYVIETPKILKYPLDVESLYSNENLKDNEADQSSSQDVYEHLLQQTNEHETVDSTALVSSTHTNSVDLQQEILNEYEIGQLTEKVKLSCGIVHGNIKVNPTSYVHDLNLKKDIYTSIKAKKIHDLTRSQMYACPVLLQRRNLILIGPPKTGKTLAYIIPTLSLLLDDDYYDVKPGNGPRAVFVTSSAKKANQISKFVSALYGAKLTIITTHGGGLELERKVELTNGCEILVTTPKCWLRLLGHSSITNLSRLCHLIFDDADTLLETFLPEVEEIMNKVKKMLYVRKQTYSAGLQVALVGEKWTPILEKNFLLFMESPVLCITANLEAALYARVKPKMYILSPGAKVEKLKGILESKSRKERTVIVCRCADEVNALRSTIELSKKYYALVAHEGMSLSLVCGVSDKWVTAVSPPILLCTDSILSELAVTNAQHLIHFSLPENKSYFSERFATIKEHFYDRIKHPEVTTIKEHFYDRIKHPESPPPDCRVDIFLDETNAQQLPEMISLMERLSVPIPPELLTSLKQINIIKEERKADMEFCERILMFGRCWMKEKCKRRHIFNKDKDTLSTLPQTGMVKLQLLHVHNPSHYSVRLLATKMNENDLWDPVKSNLMVLGMKMTNYYSPRENRMPHGRVNVGDMVGVEIEPDVLYKRAVVTEIISRDEKLNPVLVKIHIIDDGCYLETRAVLLLYLPPELQTYEQESYDLYLTGLLPVDFDTEWSFASFLRLEQKLINHIAMDEQHFIAKILLTVGKSFVVNSFCCYEWLDVHQLASVHFSPKDFILESGLAVVNNDHVQDLVNLAIEAGILSSYPEDLKEDEEKPEKKMITEEVQWAHLEKDKCFLTAVSFSVDPSFFYLKIHKFSDRLSALQKELTETLNKQILKPTLIEANMVCAVKSQIDDEWNRGIVLEILENSEVEVLCVDYGDTITAPISDLSLLPSGFTSRLPFQAVECSLVGINSLDDCWSPEARQFFYLMTGDEDNVLKLLYAQVCEVKPSSEITSGHHYQVVLYDSNKEQQICINKELVYKGCANWDPSTKSYLTDTFLLDVPQINQTEDSDNSDLDDKSDNSDFDKKDEEDNDGIWTDEMCLKPGFKSGIELPAIKNSHESQPPENTWKDEFIKRILNGDFDMQINLQRFIEGAFFPHHHNALERGLPCPPGLENQIKLNEDTKENEETKADLCMDVETVKNKDETTTLENLNHEISLCSQTILSETSDNESNSTETSYTSSLSKMFSNIFYPRVLWVQDDFYVKLKIDLPDVTEYQVDFSEFKFCFQAALDGKYYWLDLELFGPICTESVDYSPKGQYFEIKMEKYLKGETWPRLTYRDLKLPWIKIDTDSSKKIDRAITSFLMDRGADELNSVRLNWKYVIPIKEEDADSESGSSESDDKEDPNDENVREVLSDPEFLVEED